jgi:hypothetical protein
MFSKRKPQGRITYPKDRGSVPRLFRVEGTIDTMPAGQFLVVAVHVAGLIWPKGRVQADNGSWNCQVHEGGDPPNGNFALALWLVGRQGYDEIAAWLERGENIGHYPGLHQIRDGIKLHSITLRLKS